MDFPGVNLIQTQTFRPVPRVPTDTTAELDFPVSEQPDRCCVCVKPLRRRVVVTFDLEASVQVGAAE